MSFHVPNEHRVRFGHLNSDDSSGNNGAFFVPYRLSDKLRVIASDGGEWEHVSVSLPGRCPTWEEMSHVKRIFWDAEDECVQFHPKESEYVNCHPNCLHIWRPVSGVLVTPDPLLVGPLEVHG